MDDHSLHIALEKAHEFNAYQFWHYSEVVNTVASNAQEKSLLALKTKLNRAAREYRWAHDPFDCSSDNDLEKGVLSVFHELMSANQQHASILSRFKGSMHGLILGDVVGSYFEFSEREPKVIPRVDSLINQPNVFGIRFGYTDDTIFALHAIDALLESNGRLDINMQIKHALKYVCGSSKWSPNGRCFDIGNTTRQSLLSPGWAGKNSDTSSGNGVLMKLAPYSYSRLFDHSSTADDFYNKVTQITHGSPSTIQTAIVMGLTLEMLYLGVPWKKARQSVELAPPVDNEIDLKRKFKGYCEDSLYLAFHLMDIEMSWEPALQVIMDLGGDTDTNAAIFGQLYGAVNYQKVTDLYNSVRGSIHESDAINQQTQRLSMLINT